MSDLVNVFRPSSQHVVLYVVAALLLFGGGFALARSLGLELRAHNVARLRGRLMYTPTYQSESGQQLMMVYVGSAGCAASNRPALPEALEVLKLRLAHIAQEQEAAFIAIGVALDWTPERGVEHLRKFGRFDEISAGYKWSNSMGLRYMWSNQSIEPTTPQVLVYRRVLVVPEDSTLAPRFAEFDVELLGAAAGADRILEWAQSGDAFPVRQDLF